MRPLQSFFNGKISIIRPLSFVEEDTIRRFAKNMKFPDFINSCPYGEISKRKEIKEWLDLMYKTNKKIRGNIFRSLKNVNPDYLL